MYDTVETQSTSVYGSLEQFCRHMLGGPTTLLHPLRALCALPFAVVSSLPPIRV
jgi:hypothetical protein